MKLRPREAEQLARGHSDGEWLSRNGIQETHMGSEGEGGAVVPGHQQPLASPVGQIPGPSSLSIRHPNTKGRAGVRARPLEGCVNGFASKNSSFLSIIINYMLIICNLCLSKMKLI